MYSGMVTTGIAVRRVPDLFGVCRSIKVLVDDLYVARVSYGGREVVPLPPGRYSVRVTQDWCRSRPREVEIREGELVELEAGLRLHGPAWVLSFPTSVLFPWWLYAVREASVSPPGRWRAVAELAGAAASLGLVALLAWAVSLTGWLSG